MFFVDRYSENGFPTKNDAVLQGIVDAASRSTLSAIGWGLAYPEFLRFVRFVFLGFQLPFMEKTWDRAWAQEQEWGRGLRNPVPSLKDWRADVESGQRPILIFNTTISETGERLLISPLDLEPPGNLNGDLLPYSSKQHVRGLFDLYPKSNMSVVTAARLSSTFPYIIPMARPTVSDCQAYHVADGGYYDNFGILSAIEMLEQVLPTAGQKRVLFLEIRASPSRSLADPRKGTTLWDETVGPVETMLNVRWSSQLARNNQDVQWLIDRWKDKTDILPVVFELQTKSPLSWHLSAREREEIIGQFRKQERSICMVKNFFHGQQIDPTCERFHNEPIEPDSLQ
jgi:hypothetical protein